MQNLAFTVWKSGTQTKTSESPRNSNPQPNEKWRGVRLFLKVTATAGTTPTLDVKLQEYNHEADTWIDITGAAFAQQTGAAELDLVVYPAVTVVANRAVSTVMPRTWRAVATLGADADETATYSLSGNYIL
jgi:hypothetical protein